MGTYVETVAGHIAVGDLLIRQVEGSHRNQFFVAGFVVSKKDRPGHVELEVVDPAGFTDQYIININSKIFIVVRASFRDE